MENTEQVIKNISNVLFENKEKIPDGLYLELMDKMKNLEIKENKYEITYYEPKIVCNTNKPDCDCGNCPYDYDYRIDYILKTFITELSDLQLKYLQESGRLLKDKNQKPFIKNHLAKYHLNIKTTLCKNSKSNELLSANVIVKSWKKL